VNNPKSIRQMDGAALSAAITIADMKGCTATVAALQREHERRRPDVQWGWQRQEEAA